MVTSNKFVVLISGRGSNLHAICKAGLSAQIACVISNNPQALGLELAKQFNLTTHIINHKEFSTREKFDYKLASIIDTYNPKLIVLAGFMRILSSWFVSKYANCIINIHPSILPAFTGANAQADAVKARVKISGATVHFVTDKLDHGPIIAQGVAPTMADDTTTGLANRILQLEHIIYPFTIKKILQQKVSINPNGYVLVQKNIEDQNELGTFNNTIFY
jgi:phosphoribosylglycinamide formyltransferase-1